MPVRQYGTERLILGVVDELSHEGVHERAFFPCWASTPPRSSEHRVRQRVRTTNLAGRRTTASSSIDALGGRARRRPVSSRAVPFADESLSVVVVSYRPEWPAAFEMLAAQIRAVLGDEAAAIDHVGSTSVPGLASKDCIDVQVRVPSIDEDRLVALFGRIGFRCRPEPWNRSEVTSGHEFRKLVFAPPVGARTANVHVRERGGGNARFALLFRDYLRSDGDSRQAWGAFKQRLAMTVPNLLDYGQIKSPATEILMAAAERWAADVGW